MSHFARLRLIGRVAYYLGWLALLCGGLVHLNVASRLFRAITVLLRNLFELSVVCLLICIASDLRARDSAEAEVPNVVQGQAAA